MRPPLPATLTIITPNTITLNMVTLNMVTSTNTMPMPTLLACAEELEVTGATADQDPSADLQKLADAGIDMGDVTDKLLREGIDLPEVTLVAILDADKEGFLRSTWSLIQVIGRAARNTEGQVVMYADTMTESMKAAIDETNRRRAKQVAYNTAHGIEPKTIIKEIRDINDRLRAVAEAPDAYAAGGARGARDLSEMSKDQIEANNLGFGTLLGAISLSIGLVNAGSIS